VVECDAREVLADADAILEAVDQAELFLLLRGLEIGERADLHHDIGMSLEITLPPGDRLEDLLRCVAADRQVDGRDA
jgi:hypothetical protein